MKEYLEDKLLLFYGFSGIPGTLQRIKNIESPKEDIDVATKTCIDRIHETILEEIHEGEYDTGRREITNISDLAEPTNGVNKSFVDAT